MVFTSETLERTLASLSFYTGKIGIDNFLLIIVGILYYCVYRQYRHAPLADLHWRTAVFFLGCSARCCSSSSCYSSMSARPALGRGEFPHCHYGLFHALFEQWKRAHWK